MNTMTASARQVETSAELCCKQDGSARGKREKLKVTETLTENDYGKIIRPTTRINVIAYFPKFEEVT